jgi:hypothetical protein
MGAAPSKRPAPRWCPRGITKTQKRRLQKMRKKQLAKKKEEEERDYWFKCLRPMSKPKQMWQEKWLAKEENGSSGNSSGEEEVEVTLAKGDSNPGWVSGNPESGNHNPDSGNSNPGKENDWQGEESVPMDVNIVSNIVPVEKKNMGKIWICVDFRNFI